MKQGLELIKQELKIRDIDIYNQIAKFVCFSDNVFTYVYTIHMSELNTEKHEFCFICDDILLSEMTIENLLNLKRLSFFSHRVYLNDERIGGYTANIKDNLNLN